ncbi:hypothetical protein KFE94_00675 [bacterium SCSIO 12643]|nr:hypothetical protein KFE94_00675 [bacterium SCSIO 12643]
MDIREIIYQFRWRLGFTILIIIVEALLGVLFPYFIGQAIDGMLHKNLSGIWNLGLLGGLLIIMGGFRRYFDSRFYAKIYIRISTIVLKFIPKEKHSLKTARLNMLAEMVRFAENELPMIVQHSIGLIGVMTILAFLSWNTFLGALVTGAVVLFIYVLSGGRTLDYNHKFNNELESQVDVIRSNQQSGLRFHLLKLMRWNIKLSDIETINYSISWLIMMILLIITIYFSASEGVQYGALFALIMYVYQYIESVVSLPLYYQHWLRLSEISKRIKNIVP